PLIELCTEQNQVAEVHSGSSSRPCVALSFCKPIRERTNRKRGRPNLCSTAVSACLCLLVQSGCLKSPASDLVVVPGAVAEDVAIKSDAELPIDRAGSNCNVVVPVTLPEQRRTALLAESSPPRIA